MAVCNDDVMPCSAVVILHLVEFGWCPPKRSLAVHCAALFVILRMVFASFSSIRITGAIELSIALLVTFPI
jgi:hypothetical protein